jgi:hypothetical protein
VQSEFLRPQTSIAVSQNGVLQNGVLQNGVLQNAVPHGTLNFDDSQQPDAA